MIPVSVFSDYTNDCMSADRSDLKQYEPLQNLIRVQGMKPFAYVSSERDREGEIVLWIFDNGSKKLMLFND